MTAANAQKISVENRLRQYKKKSQIAPSGTVSRKTALPSSVWRSF